LRVGGPKKIPLIVTGETDSRAYYDWRNEPDEKEPRVPSPRPSPSRSPTASCSRFLMSEVPLYARQLAVSYERGTPVCKFLMNEVPRFHSGSTGYEVGQQVMRLVTPGRLPRFGGSQCRCRANMAHIRQSPLSSEYGTYKTVTAVERIWHIRQPGPDFGLDFTAPVVNTLQAVPLRLEAEPSLR